jgi:hypothetical protein
MPISSKGLKQSIVLSQIFILFFILNTISCKCNNRGVTENGSAIPILALDSQDLEGEKVVTTATFQLAKPGDQVDLTKFYLKVSIVKQEGGINSYLNYKDTEGMPNIVEELTEKLTHFTELTSLEDNKASFRIDFKVIHGAGVRELTYRFELLNEAGEPIDNTSVFLNWNPHQEPLLLVREDVEKKEGDDKKFKLSIHNPNNEPTKAGKLKLEITRTEGKEATIIGATPTTSDDTFELTLPWILGNHDLTKVLVVDPKTDHNATFEIQLFYKEKPQGNPIIISWEQGMLLKLALQREGNPLMLTYSVENLGTVVAQEVRLQYVAKTAGAKLRGEELEKDEIKEIRIGDIDINSRKEQQVLGALDFGINKSADFEFKLVYDGGNTNAEMCTFTPLDVRLSMEKLMYDLPSGRVIYSIRNEGTAIAKKVQVKYTNVSKSDIEEQNVELDGKQIGLTTEITIPPKTSTAELEHVIDFKKADKATFRFEVIYDGIVVKQTTIIETFKAKEVKINLVPVDVDTADIVLTGSKRSFDYKIEVAADSRPIANIDPACLQIDVINILANTSFLSKAEEANKPIKMLTNGGLGKLGDEITLLVNPITEKEAQFNLVLYYKKKPKGTPLNVTWQEDKLEVKGFNSFVGNNEASFMLYNAVAAIDPNEFIVELTSEKGTKFEFIKLDNNVGGSVILLKQLIGVDQIPINTSTKPICFKLAQTVDNIDKDYVTVTIKRGDTTLASKKEVWNAKGISLEVHVKNNRLEDDGKLSIKIENKGRSVEMHDIQVKLNSEQGIQYKLGKITGDKIITSLDEILGKRASSKFKKRTSKSTNLQLISKLPIDKYRDKLTLELSSKDVFIYTKDLVWINEKYFNQSFISLNNQIKDLQTKLELNKKVVEGFLRDSDYKSWNDNVKQIPEYKQRAEEIQQLAIDLINKLEPELQINERKQVQNEIVKVAEQISVSTDEYVLDALKIAEQKISDYLEQTKLNANTATSKVDKLKGHLSNDFKVDEAAVEDAIQLINEIVSTDKQTEKIIDFLKYIGDFANSMKNQTSDVRISQADARCELITENSKAVINTVMEELEKIAEKIKAEMEEFRKEVNENKKQLDAFVEAAITYFADEHTSFFKPIKDGIKQNGEELFSKFSKKFTEHLSKTQLGYQLINRMNAEAANAIVDGEYLTLNKAKTFNKLKDEAKEMYEEIQKTGKEAYSVASLAASTILGNAEQKFERIDKKDAATKYQAEGIEQGIEDTRKLFQSIGEFYRQNGNINMQTKASELQRKYDILN